MDAWINGFMDRGMVGGGDGGVDGGDRGIPGLVDRRVERGVYA